MNSARYGFALLLVAFAASLSGCQGAASALGLLALAVLFALPACTRRHGEGSDDAADAGGAGRAGSAARKADGGPSAGAGQCGRSVTAGRSSWYEDDAGNERASCCEDGITEQCACPFFQCNYGMDVLFCDDGTCREDVDLPCNDVTQCLFVDDPGEALQHTLPRGVALSPDWEPCCVGGEVRSCFEPPGLACNYGRGWSEQADGSCQHDEVDLDGGL
jgi:hypothetical protein